MIFNKPELLTHLPIWAPRYKDKYDKELAEPLALLACYKVNQGSPWLIIEFTKRPSLKGLRFCIKRSEAERCKLDSNTKIPCYAVPMSKLQRWDTVAEVKQVIASFGW